MDDERVLTISRKRGILRASLILTALLVLDAALWFVLGREKLLLWIGCALGAALILIGLWTWRYVWFQRVTANYTVSGKRKLIILLIVISVAAVLLAGYFLLPVIQSPDGIFG